MRREARFLASWASAQEALRKGPCLWVAVSFEHTRSGGVSPSCLITKGPLEVVAASRYILPHHHHCHLRLGTNLRKASRSLRKDFTEVKKKLCFTEGKVAATWAFHGGRKSETVIGGESPQFIMEA